MSRAAIFLCGPTAIGKSAVAMELAERLNGEIISVDSMQVYRGMDVGTAKPSAEERARVPHHLIDVVDLNQNFDAATFVRLAKTAEQETAARGRVAIYCGGTGLYFNARLRGLGDAPPADATIRAELEATPLGALLEELKVKDPETFGRIDRSNPRRVVRALEVIRITGKRFSAQRAEWTHNELDALLIGLEMERSELSRRIDARVDAMFRNGLVEETRRLLVKGLRENRTAAQALGYKQVIEHLDGKLALKDTIELVKLRTRQFAKRQFTWFKRQLPVRWIEVKATDSPAEIAQRLIDVHKLV